MYPWSYMLRRGLPALCLTATFALCGVGLAGRPAPGPFAALDAEYTREIRPLMRQYCTGCHSTAKRAGELDLERFATLAEARKVVKAWTRVPEMVGGREMPPKGAKQPTPAQREKLLSWAKRFLDAEARSNPGDPGPVVLRRLNNAEYTYTIRDLTGVPLDPAREFPADSAAGEGFTNTGNSLVMSPALLTKYFDAAKGIAQHVELLPDGFRFSPSTTRADWTNEALARIRELYARYSDSGGAETVNLQGIVFKTNDGGRLPVERYLSALLADRAALQSGKKSFAAVAGERKLSARYLELLWTALNDRKPSPLLDPLREQWRKGGPDSVGAMVATISGWQRQLWKFNTVGQIGRKDGPKAWQEAVAPVTSGREIRLKLPPAADGKDVRVYLAAGDAGDGAAGDFALWSRPRLVAPGRPDLPLRDLRRVAAELAGRRQRLFAETAKALAAADAASRAAEDVDPRTLTRQHGVDPEALEAWLDYLGVGASTPLKLSHFRAQDKGGGGHAFINGWSSPDLPSIVANSSDQAVRIPGKMKPHGVCVHPTPTLSACVGWQSPVTGMVRIEGVVTHAHPECGNGVTWALEARRGGNRRRLAAGIAQGAGAAPFAAPGLTVRKGDLVSLVIGPRNGDHSCDLTDLELNVRQVGEGGRSWSLTGDVASDILAGNPHADRQGNPAVWHFYSEPVSGSEAGPVVPPGSLLAKWQSAETPAERQALAEGVRALLTGPAPADAKSPDGQLYAQASSLSGPLLSRLWRSVLEKPGSAPAAGAGLDPALFGRHPGGGTVDAASLCVRAPSTLEVRIPADLADGAELVAGTGPAGDGTVQMRALTTRPEGEGLAGDAPVLAADQSAGRKRFEGAFAEFRALFPAALCYPKIVPVDEVVTLILFYREDEPLKRLMLTPAEGRELDRLWAELLWTSQGPLKQVTALEQIREFATQDRPDLVPQFDALKQPVKEAAEAFQRSMVAAEPKQLDQLLEFAARAYRRPLTAQESADLRNLYRKLRAEELPHEEAFRLTMARVFTAPAFLYRLEAAPRAASAPVTDWELASRLSYFLWSSCPDDALRAAAASGKLRQPEVLSAQLRRMLKDPKIRRLSTEFACQWLHIYEFDALDEKSDRHFPEFKALRGDMYEEAIRFFTDLFQQDRSVLSAFDADHTFVNARLAKFYGFPADGLTDDTWRRVDGVRARGRGGLLGLAATLAKQSGASRTSPILRGNWVSEVLLGERLPRPPKNIPQLPEDETAIQGLTVRQLVARHTSDPKCSSCHVRIDPFGFSLEGFDAIGRARTADLANRPVDTKTRTPDGKDIEGLAGLRSYLLQTRRAALLRQFCKKLLGYALGRAVQLSDEPLLAQMETQLARNGYRFSIAADLIVRSRQFREIRGEPKAPTSQAAVARGRAPE